MTGGHDGHDHPLSCHWRPVAADAYDDLDLPTVRSRVAAIARTQIITEACVIGRADPDAWLSYSRRREFYATRRGRYWPTTYTFDTVVPVVDQLAALGLLDHEKMPPGNLGRQSRFRASEELIKLSNKGPLAVIHDPHERIVLRGKDGQLIDYDETGRSSRWRRNVEEINEAIRSVAIALQGQAIRDGDPVNVGAVRFGAATNQLHRVFNRGRFSLGGRFYGGWWQNIPSECRPGITVNGVRTLEMDYPRLHPTLLYAEVGKVLDGDPYDLPDWPRDLVKVAFNTLVNADTRRAALRAIANEIGGEGAHAKAATLVAEIEVRHTAVADMFGSGAGLRLMRRDSDMTEGLLLRLIKRGVVALPIHDSYITADHHAAKGELMDAMGAALYNVVGDSLFKSIGYMKFIPQYGGTCPLPSGGDPVGGALVGCILVFFPELAQRDLFGADALAVPSSEVLGWRGGIAPSGVQRALRHEMRRRRLRHADVADRVGVSRPQFENILQGRFGAGASVASGIRSFLIDGAKTVGVGAPRSS